MQPTRSSVFTDTARLLQERAAVNDAVIVAFSGGKDSLCVLDLCCRAFNKVIAVYQYFVPGLAFIEEQLKTAEERWRVPVIQYPNFTFIEALAHGTYCRAQRKGEFTAMEGIRREEYWQVIKNDLGIDLLATGQKESDFWQRRASLKKQEKDRRQDVFHPLRKWSKFDVLAYLKAQKIPLPPTSGNVSMGVGLSTPCLLWMHDNYPDDFARMEQWFPYCRAAVYRREWHGVE